MTRSGDGSSSCDQLAFGELLFLAHDFRGDALAIDRERNEDRFPFIARDAFATKSDIFDFELNRAHRATVAAACRPTQMSATVSLAGAYAPERLRNPR